MRRREFISSVGGAIAAWPLAARAQQAGPVIGFLSGRSRAETARVVAEFHKGLAESGFVEGRNLRVEYRWAEGQYNRLPQLAAELVNLRVAVIVATGGNVSAIAAKAATSTVPIVFAGGGDPIKTGLVVSLNRPGANVTGVSLFMADLAAKRLELLRDFVPNATTIFVLANPANPTAIDEVREVEARATALGLKVHVLNAGAANDIEPAFAAVAPEKIEALMVANDPFLIDIRERLVQIAAAHAVPTVYYTRDYVDAGGLVSYGASIGDGYRKVGVYTAQILLGAHPADLPVQLPTKFELVINLKTAKALGLTVPPKLISTADEVIE
jgi:putative ABC transport system substrate-binding protein